MSEPDDVVQDEQHELDDQEWLDEQLDALIGAFDISEDAALAAITLASLAHEIGDLVADAAEHGDLEEGAQRLEAYAAQVLASPPGASDDDPGEGLDADAVLALCALLAEPDTAEATLSQVMNSSAVLDSDDDDVAVGRIAAMGLGVLAESLEERAPLAARAALAWLQARSHEILGGLEDAQQQHERALSIDPGWSPALYDLARIASDRGDAALGLSLLRRSEAREDDVLVDMLQRFVPRDRADIDRIDPCWCGSGRKYKVCHRGREVLTLAERIPWLVAKADLHLSYGHARIELHDLADWWAAAQRDPEAVLDAIADPVLRDAVLFAGGGLAAFEAERGSLLPVDEAALLPALQSAPRGVYLVEDTGRATVRVRPVGDVADPAAREVSATSLAGVRRGETVCARLLQVEDVWHAVGCVELVAADAAAGLARALADEPPPYAVVQAMFDAMPQSPDVR